MSLRERQPYMEESERLKHLHTRQYPTYKVNISEIEGKLVTLVYRDNRAVIEVV
jgi:hypothetical protein